MKINGSIKVVGIFGCPITHTLSPFMHNKAFDFLKLHYMYLPFHVEPKDLKTALEGIKCLNFAGLNITVPHKENALKYIDEIDAAAVKIGAINTVVIKNGKLKGYNTDGAGFLRSLKSGFNPKNKTVLMLGAGGAGKAAGVALSAEKIKHLFIYDPDKIKAKNLYLNIGLPKKVTIIADKTGMERIAVNADLIINTTPVGMHSGSPCVINPKLLNRKMYVYDVIYNRETELIKSAKKAGCKHSDGLGMLLYQGVAAFELWTGKKAPVKEMHKALLKALK
ncbi:MAG: shikimate dehydrogenase [Elusimicrobia bacterium RIFOXYA2_FULL_39_19]|nr:MAG: shikimate dehydrogenase [Elusimicrobia bacterium RIFOXYA2_FULL_39_19]